MSRSRNSAHLWPCAQITFAQFIALAPLGFFAAAAHAGAVFAMSAGAVSFGQIVKAAECAAALEVHAARDVPCPNNQLSSDPQSC